MSAENYEELPGLEQARLADLQSLRMLDTASESRFDRYTDLIADIFELPIVLVTLVDKDRQWFKSSCGLDLRETGRDISFCAHTIREHDVMVVPDAALDPRFAENPLVTGEPYIRFYAGAVIHGPQGYPVGTLCVIDHEPRELDERELNRLREFATLVENEIRHVYDLDQLRASLEHTAYYDPLTGLPNRRLLMDRLNTLVELSESDNRQIIVLLFNIHSLRIINQVHGSEAGDRILHQLADRLLTFCPPGGTAAHLQADEFILVLPAPADNPTYMDTTVDQLRIGLDRPFMLDGRELYVTVQIGGAIFPEHGRTPAHLLSRAAAAIRVPHEVTPHTVQFMSHEDELSITRRMSVESRLKGALERRELQLHYQPVVSLKTGEVTSFEALLRWHDQELGEIPPDHIIPIATASRIIMPLGEWVIEEVCRQVAEWQEVFGMQTPVAANVEAMQLQDAGFANRVLDAVEAAGIRTRLLRIELTEASIVHDSQLIASNLQILHEAGIHFLVDDFGTGYSSLEYLRRMPVGSIKIDRSFVHGLPDNHDDQTLTRAIISIASSLEMETIAEGVETEAQLDHLRQAGCDYVQGYLLARPMPASEVRATPDRLISRATPDRPRQQPRA